MTIRQAVDWASLSTGPLFLQRVRPRDALLQGRENRAIIRKISCRWLRSKRFSGTLSTGGTDVFDDFLQLRLEL
jgi:hypothetical protein